MSPSTPNTTHRHQNTPPDDERRSSLFVKICGITRLDDALLAVQAGASAIGFIFYPPSPRYCPPDKAALIAKALQDKPCQLIGVFVNTPAATIRAIHEEVGLSAVQLHGDESPQDAEAIGLPYIKAFRPRIADDLHQASHFPRAMFHLLDTYTSNAYGGTGMVGRWDWARRLQAAHPTLLSGGLSPQNAIEAISATQPSGIDLSSGLETSPGVKDHTKITQLFHILKEHGYV